MQPNRRRFLPERNVQAIIENVLASGGVSPRIEKTVLAAIVASCAPVQVNGQLLYPEEHILQFCDNLVRAIETSDFSFLKQPRGRKFEPVDVQRFVEDREYYGQKGHVWPTVMDDLWEIFHGKNDDGSDHYYIEIVLGGAIGVAKSYRADLIIAYQLYQLSSFFNPQVEFGLAPGSSIVFIQQSKSLTLARKVVFDQFAARIRNSPYFKEHFMFDPNVKAELRFPSNIYIYPVGGSDQAALGMNVFGGVCDELNFLLRTQDSVLLRYTGEDEFDQAERIYNQTIRRIKSRFLNNGKVPGKLVLVSSANYPDDFISRKVKEAETDPTIYCSIKAQWDMLPQDRYSGDKFLVELGSDTRQSRIIVSRDLASPEATILDVPVEYLQEFQRDIDGALRDLGGIPTGANSPFLPEREKIEAAQVTHEGMFGGLSLFNIQEIFFEGTEGEDHPNWDEIINPQYLRDQVIEGTHYALHVDVGLTQDALGLAIGHIAGYKIISHGKRWSPKQDKFIEMKDVHAPIYAIDGVLRCAAMRGAEVDLNYIRDLVLYLHQVFKFRWGTADTFQSTMLLQAFRSAKIRSGPLSVDTQIAPYTEVKEALHDERLWIPRHKVLAEEFRQLQRVVEKNKVKVDHPASGSKDCSDSVAGVVFMLQTKEATYKAAGIARESIRHAAINRPTRSRRMIYTGGRRRYR